MTPTAPTFDQIEDFLNADGWKDVTGTEGFGSKHRVFRKILDSGEVLITHISHSGSKTPGAGRFSAILRDQLRVSRQQFWACIKTGKPADRPAPEVGPAPAAMTPRQAITLTKTFGVPERELVGMTSDEAEARIAELSAGD